MQQNQELRSKQPFFKPLATGNLETSKDNFFNYEPSGHNANMRNKSYAMNQNNSTATKMREVTEVHQQLNGGSERLSSLHARLYQEADKIRRWKTQTEIEIKQKEKKIQESNQTVESLRKSILDIQIQNENLSLKLQEEMDNREDILHKVNSTRNMCKILKDHTTEVEDRLQKCETERTELKYLGKEHLHQFEELSDKFKKMEISSKATQNNLWNRLSQSEEQRDKLEKELDKKASDSESQVQSLIHQCNVKEEKISDVETELKLTTQRLTDAIEELGMVKNKLLETQEEHSRKASMLEQSVIELKCLREEKAIAESKFMEASKMLTDIEKCKENLEVEFGSQRQSLENTMLSLREEINSVSDTMEQEKLRYKELKGQLEKTQSHVEKLKSSRDILIMDKSEVEAKLDEIRKGKDKLQAAHEENLQQMHSAKAEFSNLQQQLSLCKDELDAFKASEDILRSQLSSLQCADESSRSQIASLNSVLKEKQQRHENDEIRCEDLGIQVNDFSDQISKLQEELCKQNVKCDQLEETIDSLNNDNSVLTNQMSSKNMEFEKEQERLQTLTNELGEIREALRDTNQENDEMRSRIESLEAQLDEEKEKSDWLLQERESDAKSLHEKLENKDKTSKDLESKTKSLKAEITGRNKQIKDLEKEVKSLKIQFEKLEKFKDDTDAQLQEAENEKLLSDEKCRELESKLADTETEAKAEKGSVKSAKTEIKNLKSQIDKLTKTKASIELKLTETENKNACCIEQCEELESKLTETMEEARSDREAANSTKTECNEMKAAMKKAESDKDESVRRCDAQVADLMATLEKYKQDNQKIVNEKEKQLKTVTDKLEKQLTKNKSEGKESSSLREELEEMKTKLNLEILGKGGIEKQAESSLLEIEKLNNTLHSKELEMKNMSKSMKELKSKLADGEKKEKERTRSLERETGKSKKEVTKLATALQTKDDEIKDLTRSLKDMKSKLEDNIKPKEPTKEKKLTTVAAPVEVPQTPKITQIIAPSVKLTPKTNVKPLVANKSLIYTPKVSDSSVKSTPQIAILKTPQRSILKQSAFGSSSASKKRRVVFTDDNDKEDSGSDSSSSELMEVELLDVEPTGQKGKQTPLHLVPSPRAKASSKTTQLCAQSPGTLPMKPVPRGPAVPKTPKPWSQSSLRTDSPDTLPMISVPRGPAVPKTPTGKKNDESSELKRFKELFPDREHDPQLIPDSEISKLQKDPKPAGNVRKTPNRQAVSKFFKTSPDDRKRKSKLANQTDELWFDMDEVFGFGPED